LNWVQTMIKSETLIKIARQFSKEPAGRYSKDGPNSGERFRDELLIPALEKSNSVSVDLDGTEGYGSSFLEEAFGGLVRLRGYTAGDLHKVLTLVSMEDESLPIEIWDYIDSAKPGGARRRRA